MSIMERFSLRGRVAVVTGASAGLGVAFAAGLAEAGADLALGARRAERLADTARLVTDAGQRAVAVATDVANPADCQALVDAAMDTFGRVDVLVNNAGGQFPALPSTISDNGWRAVVDLNLNGTWNVTNRFMAPMADAGSGAIVNVVHTFSLERGAPMFVHSGAARAGVVNMVKTLAPYLMRRGVTINAFAPGIFSTPGMVAAELATVGFTEAGFTDDMVAEGTTVRMGTVDEMAAMVLFLCSPAARYVCGATIIADGASMQTNWVNFFPEGEM